MDYDANLNAMCPVEIIQQVHNTDVTSNKRPEVFDNAYQIARDAYHLGRTPRIKRDCLNAVVAYFTPFIDVNNSNYFISEWIGNVEIYQGPMPDQMRNDVRDAFLRLVEQSKISGDYFSALIRQNIDIREELSKRDLHNNRSWAYVRYLAYFDTPGAYEELAERAGKEDDVRKLFEKLNYIAKLNTPEAMAILKKYENDPRTYKLHATRNGPPPGLGTVGEWVKMRMKNTARSFPPRPK